MKADRAAIERALRAPSPTHRFVLVYGPDEAGSRALAALLAANGSERVDLSGADLKADPARLADEAASLSLFGDARHIRVEPAGDEILPAVEALLELPATANPVAIVAGALKPTSKLVKLALASKQALACASYVEVKNGIRIVHDLAREQGLSIRPDLARTLFDRAAGNRAVVAQELVKIALYLDAAPDRPKQADEEAIAAIGAAAEEGDLGRLVDSIAAGHGPKLAAELLRLASEGVDGIPLIRAIIRRLTLLAPMRADVETGKSVTAVLEARGKAIFWKEKDAIAAQLTRWPADLIARAHSRLLDAERQVKSPGALGTASVNEELFALCRQVARQR